MKLHVRGSGICLDATLKGEIGEKAELDTGFFYYIKGLQKKGSDRFWLKVYPPFLRRAWAQIHSRIFTLYPRINSVDETLIVQIKLIIESKRGSTTMRELVVHSQHEFARSRSKSYMEGGISAVNATGMQERINTTLSGKPSSIFP